MCTARWVGGWERDVDDRGVLRDVVRRREWGLGDEADQRIQVVQTPAERRGGQQESTRVGSFEAGLHEGVHVPEPRALGVPEVMSLVDDQEIGFADVVDDLAELAIFRFARGALLLQDAVSDDVGRGRL